MNIKFYTAKKIDKAVKQKIKNTSTVLDIGCGIRPQTFITPIVHICAEPFDQYVQKIQDIASDAIDRNYVIIKSYWHDIIKIIPEQSVDSVFILDVIEHLEKNEGKKLLEKTEKIAKNQIIIFTPLGFLPQQSKDKKDAWGLDGGEYQEHKSGWTPEDFDDSWDIYVCKEYHFFDVNGVKYQNPYGAFYAIKTKKVKKKLINKILIKYFIINNLLISKSFYIYNKYKTWPIKLVNRIYGKRKV